MIEVDCVRKDARDQFFVFDTPCLTAYPLLVLFSPLMPASISTAE